MKLEVKELGDIKRELFIEVDQDSLKSLKLKVLDKVSKEANVPGFRKGKAPADLLEKRYAGLVKDELLKEAVPFYYQKAVEENKLDVVGMPKIRDAKYAGQSLSFTAQVDVKPKIKIESKVYAQMKLKYGQAKVEDKEITQFVDQFKEKVAGMTDKKKADIDDKTASGWAGYKGEEEFKKAVQAELYINKVIQRRRGLEQEISQTLLSKVNCGLPEAVVEEQKKHLLTQQIMDMRNRGVPEEEFKKHYDQISQKVEALAKDQVKLYYILEEIAKKEGLNTEKKDIYEVVIGYILNSCLSK